MNSKKGYLTEPKYTAYVQSLLKERCTVHLITPLHLLHKRNGEFLFGLFDVDATDPDGKKLLPYVVIRGNACIVVPLLHNTDTGDERFLMIRQRRTGSGTLSLEFPAGMLDRDVNDPAGVAQKELHEETGLHISQEHLFPLWDKPLYTSVGLQDEAVLYYGCIIHLKSDEFNALNGRLTGHAAEGEFIKVALMKREDAEAEANSAQVILGFSLFEKHTKNCPSSVESTLGDQ